MTVGDFLGHGKLDVVVANSGTIPTVSVLPGNGDGTFQAAVTSPLGGAAGSPYTGAQGHTMAAADFNGDGKLDLAAVSGNGAMILLGNGDGSFQTPHSVFLGTSPTRISAADVNGDGRMDLLAANTNGTVTVLLGNGDGTFALMASYLAASDAQDVKAADLNGDGKLDLVVANAVSLGSVDVLLGNGDGTFQPAHAYSAFSAPYEMDVGDFNNDGHMDVAVANSYTASTVTVLYGNGDGTLGAPHSYNIGMQPWDIETGDFNGDGHLDLIEGNGSAGYEMELNNGDGTFGPTQIQAASSGSHFAVGDFNNDGATDIAGTSSTGSVAVLINANNGLAALAGATQFSINAPATTTAGAQLPVTVSALDAAGNIVPGFLGTVSLTSSDPRMSGLALTYQFTAADAGTHTFAAGFSLSTVGNQTVTVSEPLMTSASQTVTVTPGQGTHVSISAPASTVAGAPLTFTVQALDVFNNPTTTYTGAIHFMSTDQQADLPADYTFTAADAGTQTFTAVLRTVSANGQSIFATNVIVPPMASPTVYLGTSGLIMVTPVIATSLSLAGGGGFIGSAHTVTVTAHDPYGNLDPTYTGTVHLASSDAATVVSADVALVNGVGTFQVTPMTIGNQTLTATDVANASITGSSTITVTPGWATRFAVSTAPSTVAGVAQAVTVTAYDSFGDVSTVYTGNVALTSNDRQAVLPAAYTFTAADAGMHTFTVTLKTATSLAMITATDTNNAAITGSQTGIVVTPAAATRFGFSYIAPLVVTFPPQPQFMAGQNQLFFLNAYDAFGNNASANYSGTVNLKSSDPQAVFPASYTFVPGGTNSVQVTFKTAGTQSITATDSVNPAITGTSSFTVGAAATSTFSITGGDGAAGVLHSVTITARDPYGNFTSGYNGTVHFTSSDPSAILPPDTALVNGIATVSVRMMTVGTQTLTATDTTTAAITGKETISVTAAVLGGFDVTNFPSTIAGTAHTFTVTARNTVGQVMSGYTGTVVFSSSDWQAALPASYTFTASDKGQHTFTATLKTVGSQSISARDSATPSINGAQSGITVTPAAAASLAIGGYPATVAGVANNFTVTVRDAFGNLATGYTGTVTFTSTDKQAVLPANYRFTSADGGTHVFSATFKTATGSQGVGGQTLTVQDTGNVALVASQTNILVSHAAMVGFALVVPSNITVGTAFTLKVIAQDAFGNKVDNYLGTIQFTTTAGITGLPANYTFTSTDNGQHSFTVTLTSSTTQTVSVVDVANTLFQSSVNLAAGATGGSGGTGGGGTGGGGTGGHGGTA